MPEQAIQAPNDAELAWIRSNLDVAKRLAAIHTGGKREALPDPRLLDEVFAAWLREWNATPSDERGDPNAYINAVGLAFGQSLVDTLGLEWAVVTDEYGTEIAVRGQPGDLLVFPTNLVAKRFETGETHFLADIQAGVAARAQELRDG